MSEGQWHDQDEGICRCTDGKHLLVVQKGALMTEPVPPCDVRIVERGKISDCMRPPVWHLVSKESETEIDVCDLHYLQIYKGRDDWTAHLKSLWDAGTFAP